MSVLTRSRRRRQALSVLTASATVVGGVALLGPGSSQASSHREAPYTQSDPGIDNTDTYAFVSPDDNNQITLIANWSPFQEPSGGPNFFPWETTAAYDINVDNDGDAKPDLVYRWTFNDVDSRGTAERGAADGTFLYNDGAVTSPDDADLRFRQTYDLTLLAEGQPAQVLLDNAPVMPNNVGVASTPDIASLRTQSIRPTAGGGKSFVGQSDDPFFLDLRIFDLLYGGNLSEVGYDTLSGYNVNSIAFQAPKSVLAANGDANANPVIGVWSTTSRQKNRVFADTNAAPGTSATDSSDTATDSGDLVQVSRLGAPLVNEAVVPANLKDFYNRTTPDKDIVFLPKVQNPEVPVLIKNIYGIPDPVETPSGIGRPDLVAAFLTGFSKKQAAAGPAKGSLSVDLNSLDLNAVSPTPAPAEYLRLNMQIPSSLAPNRLGVIAGDNAGFPNGRRLFDDVVDIELQVLEGIINADTPADVKKSVGGLGDGVNVNDVGLTPNFPYLPLAHSGGLVRKGQDPVRFRQLFLNNAVGQVSAQLSGISPAVPGGTARLVYRTPQNTLQVLAEQPLNAAGTSTASKVVSFPRGARVTLHWEVTPPAVAAGGASRGIPTDLIVR